MWLFFCWFFLSLPPTTFVFTRRNNTFLFPFIISMPFLIHTSLQCAPLSVASRCFAFCISVRSNPLPVKLLYWGLKRKDLAIVVKHFSNTVQVSVTKSLILPAKTYAESSAETLNSTGNQMILYLLQKTWREKKYHTSLSLLWDFGCVSMYQVIM